jgi:hypothetical protein
MKIDMSAGHPAMDYPEHVKTYKLFLKLAVVTIVGTAITMALLAYFVV